MKKIFYIVLIFSDLILTAQEPDSTFFNNYTSKIAYTEDFSGAIRMYKQMINFDPKNPIFYYRLGFAYLNTVNKSDSAVVYLRKARSLYSDKYKADVNKFEIDFYLARAYRLSKKIDSSLVIFESLRKETFNPAIQKILTSEIKTTEKFISNLFVVSDLDSVINSGFSEHSPLYSPKDNILIFTSRRYNANSTKYDDGQYDEDIYYSKWNNGRWSSPRLIDIFNTQYNDATASIIPQKDIIILYKDDDNGSIYISKRKNNKWQAPEKLPKPINTRNRETHASMTSDGKQIFFASDRPGGYGGLDIWTSYLQPDGTWSKPKNLGDAINSAGDEDSPNITLDGKTLYFSSNGRGGYGGFDIYKSTRTEFNTWTVAKNLGYPINSIGDDIFFTPIPHSDKAFYSSYRYGSHGKSDIFLVYLDSTNSNKKIVNYGFIADTDGNPLTNLKISIINEETGQEAISKPNVNGKFIFITEPEHHYTIKIKINERIYYSDAFKMPETNAKIVFYKKIFLPL